MSASINQGWNWQQDGDWRESFGGLMNYRRGLVEASRKELSDQLELCLALDTDQAWQELRNKARRYLKQKRWLNEIEVESLIKILGEAGQLERAWNARAA